MGAFSPGVSAQTSIFIPAGVGAVPRPVQAKLRDNPVNVYDYGAKGDGVSDDGPAFNRAFAVSACVNAINGTFKIGTPIQVARNGATLIGGGISNSLLVGANNNQPIVNIAAGLTAYEIAGFAIDRSVVAIAGGVGMLMAGTCSQAYLHDLLLTRQFFGASLAATDSSRMENVTAQANISDGLFFTTAVGLSSMQWHLDACLSQNNGGRGYTYFVPNGITDSSSTGSMVDCYTFANNSNGVAFVGTATCPIQGVRLQSCFFGADGDHEVFLNTFGGQHKLASIFTELPGSQPTGPGNATAPSTVGSGFFFTANNTDVEVLGGHSNGASQTGLQTAAGSTQVIGGRYTNNGIGLHAGVQFGINNTAGALQVIGARSGNDGGSVTQTVGVVGADGANVTVVGCNLRGNTGGPTSFTINSGAALLIGNL